jgi:CubicO group peptidase (beta-lactamase class C family)
MFAQGYPGWPYSRPEIGKIAYAIGKSISIPDQPIYLEQNQHVILLYLNPFQWRKEFSNGTVNTGLGWYYAKPGKDKVILHTGGTGGFRTCLAVNLEKKFAVVVLSNTLTGVDEVGNAIMKWLEETPVSTE